MRQTFNLEDIYTNDIGCNYVVYILSTICLQQKPKNEFGIFSLKDNLQLLFANIKEFKNHHIDSQKIYI